MKIGVITLHRNQNYGAVLQALSTAHFLRQNGFQCDIINYTPALSNQCSRSLSARDYIALSALHNIERLNTVAYRLASGNMPDADFGSIIHSFLAPADTPILSVTALAKFCDAYDAVIFGSDQIWNSGRGGLIDKGYLGDGFSPSIRKISYAASFGTSDVSTVTASEVSEGLQSFHRIGVRESTASKALLRADKSLLVHINPDPTFLLIDKWRSLEPQSSSNHVFCHALRQGSFVHQAGKLIAKEYKLPMHSGYNPHRRWPNAGATQYLSPIDWLRHISQSAFIVSNSFHCIVFALILRKPFLAIGLSAPLSGLSTRVKELLHQFQLSDRFLESPIQEDLVLRTIQKPIDWGLVDKTCQDLNKSGANYLLESLG